MSIESTRVKDDTFLNKSEVVLWEELDTAEPDGVPVESPGWADRSVQVIGVPGTGTFSFEGSNDGVNFFPLNDHFGTPITALAVPTLVGIAENTAFVRPRILTPDGNTDLDVHMHMRRQP